MKADNDNGHFSQKETDLYRAYGPDGTLLYVGISISAISRSVAHRASSDWFDSLATMKVDRFKTRKEALSAEKQAIETEKPRFNIVHNAAPAAVKNSKKKLGPALGRYGITSRKIRVPGATKYVDNYYSPTGIYRYYRRTPTEVAHLDSRIHIKKSLMTRDRGEAEARALIIHQSAEDYWSALAAGCDASKEWESHCGAISMAQSMAFSRLVVVA